MIRSAMPTISLAIAGAVLTGAVYGETISFATGENQFDMEFVHVGSPGNPHDRRREFLPTQPPHLSLPGRDPTEPYYIGGVDYEYGIAKFEVSCGIVNKVFTSGGFGQGEDTDYCADSPSLYPQGLIIGSAFDFVNWLNTSSGYEAAYEKTPGGSFSPERWEPGELGYNPDNPLRNSLARFFLPNADEFHKAAFYDPVGELYLDYSTGSNVRPTPVAGGTDPNTAVIDSVSGRVAVDDAGGLSVFGTMAQVGNAAEFEEDPRGEWFWPGVSENLSLDTSHALRARMREDVGGGLGFRIVDVTPVTEPASSFLLAIALTALGTVRRGLDGC